MRRPRVVGYTLSRTSMSTSAHTYSTSIDFRLLPYLLPSTFIDFQRLPRAFTQTSIYFLLPASTDFLCLPHRLPFTFAVTSTSIQIKFDRLPLASTLSCVLFGRWKYMEVVCCFHGSWSYFHEVDLLPWKLVEAPTEVDERFRGSRWKSSIYFHGNLHTPLSTSSTETLSFLPWKLPENSMEANLPPCKLQLSVKVGGSLHGILDGKFHGSTPKKQIV